jgi:hypothetical protein
VLWREGRKYAVTVQGDGVDGVQRPTVTQAVAAQIAEIKSRLPPDYDIRVAGAQEQSSKGQGAIVAGVPVMLFLIFTLLMLQLQSFSRAMLVFLTGPLGIAGVAGAMLLLDRPFGFVALLRVTADRHDHAQLGDPDRPDRAGPGARPAGLGRHRRGGGAALSAHRADGGRSRAGNDPADPERILGADGGGHHGRADCGHCADLAVAAGDVGGLVRGAGLYPGFMAVFRTAVMGAEWPARIAGLPESPGTVPCGLHQGARADH